MLLPPWQWRLQRRPRPCAAGGQLNPERFGFVGFGIGDEAAVQTFGRAGSLGQNGGQLPGGTRFSGDEVPAFLRCSFESPLREAAEIGRIATAPRTLRPLLGWTQSLRDHLILGVKPWGPCLRSRRTSGQLIPDRPAGSGVEPPAAHRELVGLLDHLSSDWRPASAARVLVAVQGQPLSVLRYMGSKRLNPSTRA